MFGVVVGIGSIDISNQRHLTVSALYIIPAHQVHILITYQVERDILKRCTDMFQLVVVGLIQFLTCQLALTDAQQEFSLLLQTDGGILPFLGSQVIARQHVGCRLQQTDGLAPELHIGLHKTRHYRLWGTASATLCAEGLLGIEDGIVLQFSP